MSSSIDNHKEFTVTILKTQKVVVTISAANKDEAIDRASYRTWKDLVNDGTLDTNEIITAKLKK